MQTEVGQPPPFWDMSSMFQYLYNARHDNADNLVVLEGEEGAGKSTAAMTLCILLAPALEVRFDPVMHAVYHWEDWTRVWQAGQRGNLYLLDEGGNLIFSRDHSRAENKAVVKILQQCRILNGTLIMCVPNFRWLDPYVREHRAKIRIRCHAVHTINGMSRGTATVYWRSFYIDDDGFYSSTWKPVFTWKFHGIDENHPLWRRYEDNKILKLQEESDDSQARVAKTRKRR